MLFATVALFLLGWDLQVTAAVISVGAYLFLRFRMRHPHPARRAILLWVILAVGFLVLTLPRVPEHGLSP